MRNFGEEKDTKIKFRININNISILKIVVLINSHTNMLFNYLDTYPLH